jgi:hypothetical protein
MAAEVEISTILNLSATLGSVGWAVYLFRKWMTQREISEQDIKRDALRASENMARDLAIKHREACEEIKEKIADNRRFYEKTYDALSVDNKEIIRLQRITNGRVNDLEVNLGKLQQAHSDRTGKRERQEDFVIGC